MIALILRWFGFYRIDYGYSCGRLCGNYKDLRCSVCFTCSDRVCGKLVNGKHVLWDRDNPANTWTITEH